MRLRYVATLNPPVPELARGSHDREISFLPLDRVWADDRFDPSETIVFGGDPHSYNPVCEGDLLVPKVAPTFTHGRVAIARKLLGGLGLATSEVFVVRPRNPDATRFLKYRLLAADFRAEGEASWTGVAGLKRISADFLRDVRISPRAWHQRRHISDFLDRECGRIDELTYELARLRRDLAMDHLDRVSRALEGSPEVRLRYRLVGIDQGWSPQCEERPADEGEWGILKAGCVNYGEFRPAENKRLPDDLEPRPGIEVRVGDLLMSRANTRELAGSVALVTDTGKAKLMMSDKLYRLSVSPALLPAFAAMVLNARRVRDQIEVDTTGASGSMQNISQQLVRSLLIPDCPLEQQAVLVAEAARSNTSYRSVAAEIDATLARLSEYRDALITESVVGLFDVPRLSNTQMDESLAAIREGARPEVLAS